MSYSTVDSEARTRTLVIGGIVVVFALFLIGRGLVTWGQHPHGTVDTQRVEQQIHDWAMQSLGAASTVTVQCPPDVPIASGRTFECTILGTTHSVNVTVTIRDDRGSLEFQAMYTPGQPIS